MRKPNLIIDIESKINKISTDSLAKKRTELLIYCIGKRGYKNISNKNITGDYEKIPNYSITILTFRYNGELLFREFPHGSTLHMINKRYELADDLK